MKKEFIKFQGISVYSDGSKPKRYKTESSAKRAAKRLGFNENTRPQEITLRFKKPENDFRETFETFWVIEQKMSVKTRDSSIH